MRPPGELTESADRRAMRSYLEPRFSPPARLDVVLLFMSTVSAFRSYSAPPTGFLLPMPIGFSTGGVTLFALQRTDSEGPGRGPRSYNVLHAVPKSGSGPPA